MESSGSTASKDFESSTVRDVAGSEEGGAPEVIAQQMRALEVNKILALTDGEEKRLSTSW